MRRSGRGGFTLLEVVIALAILGLALMAIFDLNAGAVASHGYTKRLTVASLLARSKMIDLEQQLYDDGLPTDDDEESGDFNEEGWPNFKWRARILVPKTDQVSPEQLIGSLLGVPLGSGGEGDLLGGLLGGLGGGAAAAAGGAVPGAGAGLAALGPMAGMAQTQITQMMQQITDTVREVHLTVSWKDGNQVDSIDLVTHVISLGPGSDRNGNTMGEAGKNSGSTGEYVNAQTGAPVESSNVIPDPATPGGFIDKTTGQKVIKKEQWNAQRGGGGGGGFNSMGLGNPANRGLTNPFPGGRRPLIPGLPR